jgi:DNA-directed RNA polymerase subunit M/transcription elongation factor TFIIS
MDTLSNILTQLVIARWDIPYSMAPKSKKAADSEDEEESVSCSKCGCTEYIAVAKQTGSGKHYTVKCKKCGTEFTED